MDKWITFKIYYSKNKIKKLVYLKNVFDYIARFKLFLQRDTNILWKGIKVIFNYIKYWKKKSNSQEKI